MLPPSPLSVDPATDDNTLLGAQLVFGAMMLNLRARLDSTRGADRPRGHTRYEKGAGLKVCHHHRRDPSQRCRSTPRCSRCAFCTWFEAELEAAADVPSTAPLDVKRDFERAMAHFAELAGNLYWLTRIHGADTRRLLHQIHQVCATRDFEEKYIRGLARRALRLAILPMLEDLSYAQLAQILSALKAKTRHLRDCRQPAAQLLPTPRVAPPVNASPVNASPITPPATSPVSPSHPPGDRPPVTLDHG